MSEDEKTAIVALLKANKMTHEQIATQVCKSVKTVADVHNEMKKVTEEDRTFIMHKFSRKTPNDMIASLLDNRFNEEEIQTIINEEISKTSTRVPFDGRRPEIAKIG